MDGGGTRMASRLSKRQGPAAVFSGPVRRWRKTWSPVASTSASLSSSRLELYRWMPQESREDNPEDASARPVKFLPLSVVLERRGEVSKSAAAVAPRSKTDERESAEQIEETQAVDAMTDVEQNVQVAAKYDAVKIGVDKTNGDGQQSPDFMEDETEEAALKQDGSQGDDQ